jgi:hypothetical protein
MLHDTALERGHPDEPIGKPGRRILAGEKFLVRVCERDAAANQGTGILLARPAVKEWLLQGQASLNESWLTD